MGCASSQPSILDVANASKNEVDEQLAKMQEDERTHYKILLLGPGEAGKSTVLKQLKCIYKGGIPLAEQRMHGMAIRRNTIQCMQAIVEATSLIEKELKGEAAAAGSRIVKLDEDAELSPGIVQDIVLLWKNEVIQAAYNERHRYWLLDAASYYFENVTRFGSESFAPNEEDIMHEGLQLFDEVVQNPIFQNTPIFVFLNKKDLFEQMIREGKPLSRCFPDYRPSSGGDASDVHLAIEEIERRFQEVVHRHNPRKHLHIHVIASRVRLEMKSAFTDVKDRIKIVFLFRFCFAEAARKIAREMLLLVAGNKSRVWTSRAICADNTLFLFFSFTVASEGVTSEEGGNSTRRRRGGAEGGDGGTETMPTVQRQQQYQ
eukprot:jgi/Undpi1/1524/HiC_scaffold_11.g04914.m1